jgi:hypothetical protein
MVISQRNGTSSVTPTVDTSYTLDRFQVRLSQTSRYSVQQNAGSVTPPAGFTNYLGVTSLSAYSVLSSDYFAIQQNIEGFNIADLAWGTANARTVTLSFWVRSSLTGTFGGTLFNNGSTRNYQFSYSIPVANTWTQISITIPGDTTGTWLTNNGIGLQVAFSLGAGSTFTGGSASWGSAFYFQPSGSTSVVGTNGATFYITGVQLERNTTATPFEWIPYSTELALCQRYYYKNSCSNATNQLVATGFQQAALTTSVITAYPAVSMRASPTIGFANLSISDYTSWNGAVSSISGQYASPFTGGIGVTHASGGVAYRPCVLYANTTAGFLDFSSEL